MGPRDDSDFQVYAALARRRTVFYTPGVLTTPKELRTEINDLTLRVSLCIDQQLYKTAQKAGPAPARARTWN
ncbi:atp-Binding protein (plasmid) [Arthrobacter sp. Hiyo8]|nr:atp-Binding protein [Arthrobacter sp. Hiyo8]